MALQLTAAALLILTVGIVAPAAAIPAQAQGLLGARVAHLQAISAAQANPAEHFSAWVARNGRGYSNDLLEYERRFAVWKENLDYAAAYNARTKSHWLGPNHLADLTQEEYRTRLLGYDNAGRLKRKEVAAATNAAPSPFRYADVEEDKLPTIVDWRKKSAVTRVKNQMQCGSCWAFSATGAMEGINAVVTNELVSLSEQELVDCDTEQDQGCRGGLMDFAFQFVIENGGINTEDDYPYTAVDGVCDQARRDRKVVTINGFEDVPENDEISLKKAVAHQPVAVAIEADQKSFQLYMGGVYDDEEGCGVQLDHGVLAAGYGHDSTLGNYWIVKNSWGAEWGESGYIRIKMGATAKEGLCGIAMAASYPTKTGPNPPTPPPTPPTPSPPPGPTPGPTPGPGPHPPKPQPEVCDDTAECPASTTCCCASPIFGMCLQWGCCPIANAICCDDNEHCCPSNLPVCDTDGGRCLPPSGQNGIIASVPWSTKIAAKRTGSIVSAIFSRRHGVKPAVVEMKAINAERKRAAIAPQ